MQGLLAGRGAAILPGDEPGVVGDKGNRRPADRQHQLRLAMQERGFLRAAVPKPPRAPKTRQRRPAALEVGGRRPPGAHPRGQETDPRGSLSAVKKGQTRQRALRLLGFMAGLKYSNLQA